ncbi:ATP-binding protein [Catenovulum sediminis]|uniref:ATP-binding protein n=1 Tax=Catenovulum sediminis TaxID=1740262 RepID=UPI00117C94F6|nr:ATP-binding protein [Catenovulum sediminis]
MNQITKNNAQYAGNSQMLLSSFLTLYQDYISSGDENLLLAFNDLGKELHQAGTPPEKIVEGYASALQQITVPNCLSEPEKLMPLMEVIMTYGISYRQQIYWQKEHSNAQFSRVLEASGHLICITDQGNQIHYTNPAFRQLFRNCTEELNEEYRFFGLPKCPEEITQKLLAGQRWQGEIATHNHSGKAVVLNLTAFSIGLGGQYSNHYVFMAEDITEQRVMEKRLQQAQRLSVLGELASGLSHELNNVMTIITGFAGLIRDESDAQSRAEYVDEILAAINKGQELNQQILSFATGRQQALEKADLHQLMANIDKFLTTAVGSNIDMNLDVPANILVSLSEQHLSQILTNLCINARHAIEKRHADTGGLIEIGFTVTDSPAWLKFTVTDNGCGMSEAVQKQIFEPFFTTKDVGKGTGLGLSLLQKLVHEYNGEIYVRSDINWGTEFIMYLPVIVVDESITPTTPTTIPEPVLQHWLNAENSVNRER